MKEDVYFYVNGPARLLQASVIAEELYPDHRKHLILLHQFGYTYDALLPHVQHQFSRTFHVRIKGNTYSAVDQVLRTYFHRDPALRKFFQPGSRVILFGLSSPTQKLIIRHNKRIGNTVDIYAESLSVNRFFVEPPPAPWWRLLIRHTLSRAFLYQHDYDTFYVIDPSLYDGSPNRHKLRAMFDLYGSRSFERYAGLLTQDIDISGLDDYEMVFLGQPLSNGTKYLEPAEEEHLLGEIIGDRRALILPHPVEELSPGQDKYRALRHSRVFRGGVPSELLLLRLRPAVTATYYSTAAVNYAMMNRRSMNYFYPIHRSVFQMLTEFGRALPNIVVSDAHLIGEDPYVSPRSLTQRKD